SSQDSRISYFCPCSVNSTGKACNWQCRVRRALADVDEVEMDSRSSVVVHPLKTTRIAQPTITFASVNCAFLADIAEPPCAGMLSRKRLRGEHTNRTRWVKARHVQFSDPVYNNWQQ